MTYDDFYAQANNLRGQLLSTRKKDFESDKYDDTLRFVLEEFYDLVGNPVIEELNEMNIPEQCRIWWCPTFVFYSFPLPAIGPILLHRTPRCFFGSIHSLIYHISLRAH
jgi:hypothetical protein